MFVKSGLIIVLLCSLLFLLQVDANLVMYYNRTHNNVSTPYVPYECKQTIRVQEKDKISMRFTFNKFINNATCYSVGHGITRKMQFYYTSDKKKWTTHFVAKDSVEGAWNCTFLHDKGTPTKKNVIWNGEQYTATKCWVTVKIEYELSYTIDNIAENSTFKPKFSDKTDVVPYYYKHGETLQLSCGRPYLGERKLPEKAKFQLIYYEANTRQSTVIDESTNNNISANYTFEKMDDKSTVSCLFISVADCTFKRSVQFLWQPDDVFPDASGQDTSSFTVHPSEDTFKNGDTLEFKCVCKLNQTVKIILEPDYNTTTIVRTDLKPDTVHNKLVYQEFRKMEVNDLNVTIKCMVFNEKNQNRGTHEIHLTRLSEDNKENKSVKSALDNAVAANENKRDSKGLGNVEMQVSLGCGVGIISILILIIVGVVAYQKKKVKKKEDGTYENLQNETSTTPLPFPQGAKLEETYLSPADCEESPYAYSHSYHHRTTEAETYALPYVEKNLDNLYSKPVPKSERGKEIAATPIYAAVPPKSQRLKETQNPGLIYAELQKKYLAVAKGKHLDRPSIDGGEHASPMKNTYDCYANLNQQTDGMKGDRKDSQYTNVFDNDSYVNNKDKKEYDDYAEPSYCELGKR